MKSIKNLESEIKALAEAGWKIKEVAEKLNLCKETVRRRFVSLGIKPTKGIARTYSLSNVPEDLKQLILGSLLGDGTFTKACETAYCMTIVHSEKQLEYLKFKENILKKYNLSSGIKQMVTFDKRYKHDYVTYRLRSRTNAIFKEIRSTFYSTNCKNITDTSIFKDLSPLGLAIWYMDDGYVTRSSCIFSTVSIPTETQEKIAEILLHNFDLHFTVGHNDNSMYLCTSDFEKFKTIIAPYITEDLQYKLVPYKYRVLDKSDELLESCDANQQPSLGSA